MTIVGQLVKEKKGDENIKHPCPSLTNPRPRPKVSIGRGHSMRLERFTIKSQEAIQEAERLAEAALAQEVSVEHLLLAIMAQEGGIVVPILERIGASVKLLRSRLQEAIKKLPKVYGVEGGSYMSQPVKDVLNRALSEATDLKDEFISTEHILLAASSDRQTEAGKILSSEGVTKENILKAMAEVRGSQRVTDQMPEEK